MHGWPIKQCAWDGAGAEREFKRAQELNPNYAEAHGLYAVYLSQMQRHEQAVAEARQRKSSSSFSRREHLLLPYTPVSASVTIRD